MEAFDVPTYPQMQKYEVSQGYKTLKEAECELAKAGLLGLGSNIKAILKAASMPSVAWRKRYEDTREYLREEAVQWQRDFSNHSYSWGEIAEKSCYFETMGRCCGLINEFRENGII